MNYVLNPYLMVGTVHSYRNPRDIEDKILLLMNHGTGERTYNNNKIMDNYYRVSSVLNVYWNR